MRDSHEKIKRLIDSLKAKLKMETNESSRIKIANRGLKLTRKFLRLNNGDEVEFRTCKNCSEQKPISCFEKYLKIKEFKSGYKIKRYYTRVVCLKCSPYRQPKRKYVKHKQDIIKVGKLQIY